MGKGLSALFNKGLERVETKESYIVFSKGLETTGSYIMFSKGLETTNG